MGIYPNSVKTDLQINTTGFENITVKIFDVLGHLVFQKRDITTQSINLSSLKKGVYVLALQSVNQQKTFKLIKE